MKNVKYLRPLFALFIPLFLASCAATSVTGTWKEASYNKPIKKILVIGLAKNIANRRIFEETLSKDFIKAGKSAEVSTKYFSDIKKINKKSLAPIVKKGKYDTVIIARVISIDKQSSYVPSAYPSGYDSMYGYYGRVSPYYMDQGYYVQNEIVSIEINMYETQKAKLVWAITTETFAPDNINDEVKEISDIIIKKLAEQKFL